MFMQAVKFSLALGTSPPFARFDNFEPLKRRDFAEGLVKHQQNFGTIKIKIKDGNIDEMNGFIL